MAPGWSEQDDNLEVLWSAIREYSQSMDCAQLIAEQYENDIGSDITVTYDCENFCDENDGEYDFTVTVYDIDEVDEE